MEFAPSYGTWLRRSRPGSSRVPPAPHSALAAVVRDQITPAVAAGGEPASLQADPIVAVLMTRCTHLLDRRDDAASRKQLLARLGRVNESHTVRSGLTPSPRYPSLPLSLSYEAYIASGSW